MPSSNRLTGIYTPNLVPLDSGGEINEPELRRYVDALTGDIKKVFVVHGEESQAMAFAETLRAMKPKAEVFVPEYKQSATI